MKNLFPEYSNPSPDHHKAVWESALFVFDTNVLLDLYRYRDSTRNELLETLDKLHDRIWIPYHVALEFQKFRPTVIADQIARFGQVKEVVNNAAASLRSKLDLLAVRKMYSLIDPAPLLDGFDALIARFFSDLDEMQASQQALTAHDALRDKIENVFHNKVGDAPADAQSLEDLYTEAERRYENRIPPGYMDNAKAPAGVFRHGALIYKMKYGDFLVWHQLLEHVKASGAKHIIFITNDLKTDWWLRVGSSHPNTAGPRPELVEEIRMYSGAETFVMYTSEQFLKYSNDTLRANISEETITEVGEVSLVPHDIFTSDF